MRRVVRSALSSGWRWLGWSGTTHAQIQWPDSGAVLRFGCTPSVASWKTLATDIKKASGVEVWRKGNRKRSRRADDVSGFDIARARREAAAFHDAWDEQIDGLSDEREQLIARCYHDATSGARADIHRIGRSLARIRVIEQRLRDEFHQPVEPFDPTTLVGGAP